MKEGWKMWREVEEKKEMRYQRMLGRMNLLCVRVLKYTKKGVERGQPCQKLDVTVKF